MNAPARLTVFVAALAVVFGLGLAVGSAVGPDPESVAPPVAEHAGDGGHGAGPGEEHGSGKEHGSEHGKHGEHAAPTIELGEGWDGSDGPATFRLLDDDGAALTSYDVKHEKKLHLVVVGTPQLTDYQHLHPELGDDGVWTVEPELAAGRYRIYADGSSGGEEFVAEAALRVPGERAPGDPMPAETTRQVSAGYAVTLDNAADGTATLRVTKDGVPVRDLEPYLGAYGHLVVLRAGSLDYLHAHPEDGPAGPEVRFAVEYAKPGRHRLFFEFQHGGEVRTVAFTHVAGKGKGGHGHGDH